MLGYSYLAGVGNESPLARRHPVNGRRCSTNGCEAWWPGSVPLLLGLPGALFFFVLLVQPSGVGRDGR